MVEDGIFSGIYRSVKNAQYLSHWKRLLKSHRDKDDLRAD